MLEARAVFAIELGCLAVIAFYLAVRHRAGDLPGFLRAAAVLAPAAWLAEDTCIRLYGFYGYAPAWHAHADRVPLLIAIIWPLVILSARALARHLAPDATAAKRAALTGALVVLDAAFIEPVAVRAGLWSWTVPGIFGVPLMGILGWGLFAGAATFLVDVLPGRTKPLAILLSPLATHAALLAAWWGFFRWIPRPLPDVGALAVAAAGSAVLAVRAASPRAAPPVPLHEMVARLAAASFFFVLLASFARREPVLLAYALAFAPPYLVLMARSARFAGRASTPERA